MKKHAKRIKLLALATLATTASNAKAGIIADGVDLVTDQVTELSAGALAVLGITVVFVGLKFARRLMNRA